MTHHVGFSLGTRNEADPDRFENKQKQRPVSMLLQNQGTDFYTRILLLWGETFLSQNQDS